MSSPQQPPPPPADTGTTHQAAQVALGLLVAAAIAKLWPHLLANPDRVPAFKAAVAQEVIAHAEASATLAARQYDQQRHEAGETTTTYRSTVATLPSADDIGAMVDEALAGLDFTAPESDVIAGAQAHLAAAAKAAVLDTGARTVLGNVEADRRAIGYARVPEAGACAFCLMLATRGAVYKAHSWDASDATKTDGKVPSTIKAHDHCECHPEPVFTSYEPPARVRAADALWIAAAKGSRKTATIRFRQAVEGRIPADDKAFTDEQRAHIAALRAQL